MVLEIMTKDVDEEKRDARMKGIEGPFVSEISSCCESFIHTRDAHFAI